MVISRRCVCQRLATMSRWKRRTLLLAWLLLIAMTGTVIAGLVSLLNNYQHSVVCDPAVGRRTGRSENNDMRWPQRPCKPRGPVGVGIGPLWRTTNVGRNEDVCASPVARQGLESFTSIGQLRRCLASIPLTTRVLNATTAALALATTKVRQLHTKSRPTCGALPIARFVNRSLSNLLQLHTRVHDYARSLCDEHVQYKSPVSQLASLCLPVEFGSRIERDSSSLHQHQVLFIAKLGTQISFPDEGLNTDVQMIVGHTVKSIDGLSPFDFIKKLLGGRQAAGQATRPLLNNALHRSCFDVSTIVLPESDGVHLLLSNGRTVGLPWTVRLAAVPHSTKLRCLLGDTVTERTRNTTVHGGSPCSAARMIDSTFRTGSAAGQEDVFPSVHRGKGYAVIMLPSFRTPAFITTGHLHKLLSNVLPHSTASPIRTLVLDVSGNRGGLLSTMYGVLEVLVKALQKNGLSPASAAAAPCLMTMRDLDSLQQSSHALLPLLQAFPTGVCKRCSAALLEKIEAYARAADLPFNTVAEVMRVKTSLYRAVAPNSDGGRSELLLGLLLSVLRAQSESFLGVSGLEARQCLRHARGAPVPDFLPRQKDTCENCPAASMCTAPLKMCSETLHSPHSLGVKRGEPSGRATSNVLQHVKRVVVVSDGVCYSTCAQFVYLLGKLAQAQPGLPTVHLVTYGGIAGEQFPAAQAGNAVAYDYDRYAAARNALSRLRQRLETDGWWKAQGQRDTREEQESDQPSDFELDLLHPAKLMYPHAAVIPPEDHWASKADAHDLTEQLGAVGTDSLYIPLWPEKKSEDAISPGRRSTRNDRQLPRHQLYEVAIEKLPRYKD